MSLQFKYTYFVDKGIIADISSITEITRQMMSEIEEFGELPGTVELYNNQDKRDDDTISEIDSLISQMLRSNE